MISAIFLILGLLCFAYGFCILRIASGTLFWSIWFVIGLCLCLLAYGVQSGWLKRLPKGMLYTGIGIISAGLLVFLFLLCRILSGFQIESKEAECRYLIVLGAQVREDGPSRVLRYRLDAAAAYLEGHPDTICIVSGGKGGNEPREEAAVMREYLLGAGISDDRILTEGKSTTTEENLRFSEVYLAKEQDAVGVVTNDFHVYRAVQTALKCGYQHVCGVPAASHPFYLPNNVLREILAMIKFYLS
ncbi:MAG: YdcF family protein [Eubacteriales bacterium]|nr:YdcF family protein [Eubacteriales bacterium]